MKRSWFDRAVEFVANNIVHLFLVLILGTIFLFCCGQAFFVQDVKAPSEAVTTSDARVTAIEFEHATCYVLDGGYESGTSFKKLPGSISCLPK